MTTQTATIHAETADGAVTSISVLQRVRAEYREMPGLTLTEPQAARLWSLSASQSLAVLSELVGSGFLIRDARGIYRRRGCPGCS